MKLEFEKKEPKDRQVGIRMNTEEFKKLDKFARKEKVSVSDLVRTIIKSFLNQ